MHHLLLTLSCLLFLSTAVLVGAQDVDTDLDGVPDAVDLCPESVIPETAVPTQRLKPNRCVVNPGPDFVCGLPPGQAKKGGVPVTFTLAETLGCTCEQIIAAQDLGKGHTKFGCSRGAIEEWIDENTPELTQ